MTIQSYMIPGARSALISAARDHKHRPLSHPLIAGRSIDEQAYYDHIGRRIRLLRTDLGLTQRQMGARIGVSGVTVHHWEHAHQRPTAFHVYQLERAFGEVRP